MKRKLRSLVLVILSVPTVLVLAVPDVGQSRLNSPGPSTRFHYPPAKRVDQVDRYHGIEVADPYRWLEDMESDETRGWVASQDELLKMFVAQSPGRTAIRKRLIELGQYEMYASPRFVSQELAKRGGQYFYIKTSAGASQPVLYVQEALKGRERVVLDLRARQGDDTLRLAGFSTSPDGRLVAYQVSNNLSNWLSLNVLDVTTGKDLPDALAGLHFSGGPVTWTSDSKGFFYTQFDKPKEGSEQRAAIQNPKVFYHEVKTSPATDRLVYAQPDKTNLVYNYQVTDDGSYLVLSVAEGASNKNIVLYKDLRTPDSAMRSLIREADANYTLLGSSGSRFWFYTDLDAARGRIIAIDIDKPQRANWVEVIPQAQEPISAGSNVGGNALGMFGNRFVLVYLKDGRPLLRVFDLKGKLQKEAAFPEGGSIWGGFYGSQRDPEVFYRFLELTSPSTVYRLNLATGRSSVFRRATLKVSPDDFVVKQVFFRSKDGTRVPMFIAHKRGLRLDGNNPTYMYGYGAFGWVSFTWFQPHMIAWMENGGVFAVAGIRGGGEYGDDWHQAGMKLNKQNTIDDYLAAAEWLIENRYTSRARLVANGGSASGAVAAAAILQRPDLFGASVIDIPVLDMLRFDKFTAASYWKPEFGSPADSQEFKALYAYSPYHNVRQRQCYPPTLVMAGERDQTAVPLHAYKFVAAMQWAQGCDHPVLLKLMRGTGHNFGSTPERSVDSWTDLLSFLFRTLDLKPAG